MQAGPWGRLWASEFRRLVTDMGYFRSWYQPSTFQPSTLIHIVAHLTCRSWRKGTLHNIHIVLKYGGKYCLWAHWSLLNPHVFNINHITGNDTCYKQQRLLISISTSCIWEFLISNSSLNLFLGRYWPAHALSHWRWWGEQVQVCRSWVSPSSLQGGWHSCGEFDYEWNCWGNDE